MLAAGRSCLIWSFKDLRITFLRTGVIRGFGFTWRVILRFGLGVGLVVGIAVNLGAGRGVCFSLRGVRLPVITNSPFSTVKSIQVLLQSAAMEKALPGNVKISTEIIRVEKTLTASSKQSATYSHFDQFRKLLCLQRLESLTQLHFLNLIAKQ